MSELQRDRAWFYLAAALGTLGLVALAFSGCVVQGTKGCNSWHEDARGWFCRDCPDRQECKHDLPQYEPDPADAYVGPGQPTSLVWRRLK